MDTKILAGVSYSDFKMLALARTLGLKQNVEFHVRITYGYIIIYIL